ncbi:MAG: MATE family efflux transporter, partial [Sphingobacteriaceae bacterium]
MFSKYKPHYISNLTLAIPVVISQLGHTLVHMADSIIVGHFAGTISLAAVSLVNSIFTVMMVIGIGISYGLTPLIAQENGKKNFRECGKLLSNSLLINILTGILLFVVIYFGLLLSIDHLDQSPEVVEEAKPYLGLLGISIIPLMVFMTFKQFAEGLGFTKQAMIISIVGNVINVILGVIFVKGLFGIKPMGVSGVGLSTLIDRCLMAITMSFYIVKSPNFKPYLKNFALRRINKIRSLKIFKIGGPVAMQYAFEVSAFSGAAIIIGTIGAAEQAAHQVAINLAAMTYMMASGISAAATIKTGNSFGRKDFEELRLSANSNYHIVIVFMVFTAMVFVGLNQVLPLIYTTDQSVIVIASQLLIIAGLFQLFDGAQVVGLGILRGMGDVNVPTFITFIAYWIIGLPIAYVLGITFSMGTNGVWYGLTLGLLVSAA